MGVRADGEVLGPASSPLFPLGKELKVRLEKNFSWAQKASQCPCPVCNQSLCSSQGSPDRKLNHRGLPGTSVRGRLIR